MFDEGGQSTPIALFPEDRVAPVLDCDVVSIRLSQMRLRRPRQWGACWLAMVLWDQLRLDNFWRPALPPSREGTDWLNVLKTLVAYQPDFARQRVATASALVRALRQWATCWARTSRWSNPTISIAAPGPARRAQTGIWARFCASAGRTCSRPTSRCSCMI